MDYSKQTTEQLVALVGRGDEQALDAVYRRKEGNVLSFALQLVADERDAEDVVIDTFLEVWRNAARFVGKSQASTWILGIARHKSIDKLRLRRREQVNLSDDEWRILLETIPCNGEPTIESISRRGSAAKLHRCMAQLPSEQRECLQLVFFDDLGLAEIASLQGVPENTVKTRVFYARRKLRALLQEHDMERGYPIASVPQAA